MEGNIPVSVLVSDERGGKGTYNSSGSKVQQKEEKKTRRFMKCRCDEQHRLFEG